MFWKDDEKSRVRVCPYCNGTGRCRHCRGSGIHNYPGYGRPMTERPCGFCRGTGVCQHCRGRGVRWFL